MGRLVGPRNDLAWLGPGHQLGGISDEGGVRGTPMLLVPVGARSCPTRSGAACLGSTGGAAGTDFPSAGGWRWIGRVPRAVESVEVFRALRGVVGKKCIERKQPIHVIERR